MIKTIKHGITVLATNPANVDCWDEHLAKVLFGYKCGVQTSTKFLPFMVLTSRSPRLKADNYLGALTGVVDDGVNVEQITAQFLEKVNLIASIHESVAQCRAGTEETAKHVCKQERQTHVRRSHGWRDDGQDEKAR
jgi:hypothetical protein